ncbi:MAG: ABC transporter permease [Gemmatimonadetes bacterium]|nr:ABC transporter permease [Gemmatimonadota bacterium]
MRWTKRWRKRLRTLLRNDAVERELDEELAFHLAMEIQKNHQAGMSPEEARRQAAIRFGGLEKHKEEVRDARVLGWVPGLSLDFKLGLRMMVKHPGLTVVGGLGMAVAIALGASAFSVLNTMIDPALPLDEGDRIVAIQNLNTTTGQDAQPTHLHDLLSWREELRAVEQFGAYRTVDRNLITGDGSPEPLRIAEMTASGFRVARVPPLLGRYLVDEDERPGAPPVVVIGHDVWKNRFASRPDIVGHTLQLGAARHTVVGVMPPGFAFPVNNRLWTPLRLNPPDYPQGQAPPIEVFGRLAPGATLEQAQAQLATIGQRAAAAHPETHQHIRARILPYARSFIDAPELAWVFYLVQLLVSMVLVVIAVNVAILVYARTATRMGEIAVRLSLGASRARIVAQLFAEAFVLAAAAAVVGLVAARFALQQVNALVSRTGGEQIPFWWNMGLSPSTVLYVVGLAVLAAVIVGVVPALKVTGHRVQSSLRQLGGGTGMQMGRTWTVLIVAQVAVAVAVLPIPVALMMKEFVVPGGSALAVPAEEIVTARIAMDWEAPARANVDAQRLQALARFGDRHAELVRRVEMERGVRAVSFASSSPGMEPADSIEVAGTGVSTELARHRVGHLEVDPGLFDVLGARMLSGRPFQPGDLARPATAVIVNRSFVQSVLDGGNALGRRLRYRGAEEGVGPGSVEPGGWYEIVGVVTDLRTDGSEPTADAAAIYHPTAPGGLGRTTLFAHVQGVAPEVFAGRLRAIAAALDPTMRVTDVQALADLQFERHLDRMLTLALGAIMLIVLCLSAAGIHSLMSLVVVQRRKEIGIRTALGARPRQVLRTVFARSLRQLGLGVGIGALVGGALIPAITTTTSRAAGLLVIVAALMLTVGLLAALGPARRGLRIQPMEVLRADA